MIPALHCCLQRAALIGLSPPRALTSPHPLPFPREVVPTQPPECPYLTARCRVHTEEGTGPRRWGAQVGTPLPAVGDPSPTAAVGP